MFSMQLGVYTSPLDYDEASWRVALYDFDAGEWDDTSDGRIVEKASRAPSPEEIVVRFDIEDRRYFVATPEQVAASGASVTIRDPDMSVQDGHAAREDSDGPFLTQAERQYRRDQDICVVPDGHDLSDRARKFYDDRSIRVVSESNAPEFVFAEQFDFDFTVQPTDTDDSE
jgi:hypothetical protein